MSGHQFSYISLAVIQNRCTFEKNTEKCDIFSQSGRITNRSEKILRHHDGNGNRGGLV